MAMPFRLASAAVLGLLGGCQSSLNAPSQVVFDAVGVAVPLTASEARKYDGSYQGRITQLAGGPGCPNEQAERVIMVGDGVLWYAYTPVVLFASPVAYDGTIDATSGATHMTGQVRGDRLTAMIESPTCKTRLSMRYIYNRS